MTQKHVTTLMPTTDLVKVAFVVHVDALAAVDNLARQAEHSRSAELRQAVRSWINDQQLSQLAESA